MDYINEIYKTDRREAVENWRKRAKIITSDIRKEGMR